MIRLIASDIDGTLVADGTGDINPEVFDCIEKLHKCGIMFAAASGRHWTSIENLFRPVQTKIFYLADNGAYVGMHGRNLFLHQMDREQASYTIERIRNHKNLQVMLSAPDACYVANEADPDLVEWLKQGYGMKVRQVEDLTTVNDIIKVSAYSGNEDIRAVAGDIYEELHGKLQTVYAGAMWMDVSAPGVNKGEAVEVLQKSLSILPSETMVFGDQNNDLSMLKSGYYSFAVANAVDEVRKAARFGAERNTDDGVLKILKTLL